MQQHDDEPLRATAPRARETKASDTDRPADPVTSMQQSVGNRAVAQMLNGGVPDDDPAAALEKGLSSPGSALPGDVQREMEGALGADLSSVRVHSGAEADQSAQGLGARAYTVGEDVVLGKDVGSASTDDGKRTLAHELTHVVQQRSGPVDGTDVGGGVNVSDPSDRFERAAEASANAIVAGGHSSRAQDGPPRSEPGSAVQREEGTEEELAPPTTDAAEDSHEETT